MASSAIANNYGPNTIQLEGAVAVSAAKEREAKNALQASNIQHSRELRTQDDARKKAENEKLSLERRHESLVDKCNATDHQKMGYESENKQLKGELSSVKFSYEKETRENLRQIEDIKRDNGIKMEQQRQDFERQHDVADHKYREMKQNLSGTIEEHKKEITNKNEKLQNKEVEIQNLKLDHKKEIMDTTEKLKKESKKKVDLLTEQHGKDLDERGLEIEKVHEENNKIKGELSEKINDYEQKLLKQADDDHDKLEEIVRNLESEFKKKLDDVEEEKNGLERHFLSELKSQKVEFNNKLRNIEDRHKLNIQAKKDEFAKAKRELEGNIEKHLQSIKDLKDEMIEQENEFNRNIKQQLTNKEDELTTNFAQKLKKAEDELKDTFQHEVNVMKNDMQFKIDRANMAAKSTEEDLKREKEKTHRIVNDLERAERNCRDSKHNAKLAAERMETDIDLLKKKLAHEKELSMRELRSFRTPYNIVGDSGLHSPERRGSMEEY